jgi:hypothetical protein
MRRIKILACNISKARLTNRIADANRRNGRSGDVQQMEDIPLILMRASTCKILGIVVGQKDLGVKSSWLGVWVWVWV